MAIEIARLRAWLSIVVDQPDVNNIEPLPNLDFKFVCANSLIPLEVENQTNILSPDIHDQLVDIRDKYYRARTKESKESWRQKYYKLTDRNPNSEPSKQDMFASTRRKQLNSFNPFKFSHPAEFFDSDYMFGVPLFDIVIGNPPYGAKYHQSLRTVFKRIYESANTNKNFHGSLDTYVLFIEMGYRNLTLNGVLNYIVPLVS